MRPPSLSRHVTRSFDLASASMPPREVLQSCRPNSLTPFPSDDFFPTTGGERGTTRDAYLDNCKFALMILIGVGHSLQWLLPAAAKVPAMQSSQCQPSVAE